MQPISRRLSSYAHPQINSKSYRKKKGMGLDYYAELAKKETDMCLSCHYSNCTKGECKRIAKMRRDYETTFFAAREKAIKKADTAVFGI